MRDIVTSSWLNELKNAQQQGERVSGYDSKTRRELEKPPLVDIGPRLERERARRANKQRPQVQVLIYGKGWETHEATKEVLPETREQW
jgi:hypothetical protein